VNNPLQCLDITQHILDGLPRTYFSLVPETLICRYRRSRPTVPFLAGHSYPSVDFGTDQTQATMKAYVLLLMALVTLLQVTAIGNGVTSPDCTSKCWDNSKLLSSCPNESKCFCDDSEFQSAVFQCLHSQCQTAQFGSAIHSALMECSGADTETHNVLPHLIRHQKSRKRHNAYSDSGSVLATSYGSGYSSTSRTYSATFRHATGSASGYSRSRSASLGHNHSRSKLALQTSISTSFASLATSHSFLQTRSR